MEEFAIDRGISMSVYVYKSVHRFTLSIIVTSGKRCVCDNPIRNCRCHPTTARIIKVSVNSQPQKGDALDLSRWPNRVHV